MTFMPPFGPSGPQMPPPPPSPPFGGPGAGGGGVQPPTAPPPQTPPPQPLTSTLAVDPGAIVGCLFRNTYIWPTFGQGFWFYPVFVGRTSVAGFRWTGRIWVFSGYDLNRISSFSCF